MSEKPKIGRRNFVKWGSMGLLASFAGPLGPAPGMSSAAQETVVADHFSRCVYQLQTTSTGTLLGHFVRCLPELQTQPQPVSDSSLEERLQLGNALQDELAGLPATEIISRTFPVTIRYPAWLAAGISVDLFGLVLENSPLPEFELKAWAYEHVEPHVASLDRALAPFSELLQDPTTRFSPELARAVATHVDALRGRLVLLGDRSLIAMAERLGRLLAQGDRPVLVRVFTTALDEGLPPTFTAELEEHAPFEGDVTWHFRAGLPDWEQEVRGGLRAIDRVVSSILIVGLLLRQKRG